MSIGGLDMLYSAPIIVYGAGIYGNRVRLLLETAGCEIAFFTDKDIRKKVKDYEIISLNEVYEICQSQSYVFILASRKHEEMKKELESRKINAKYMFTAWEVENCLLSNFDDVRISQGFKEKWFAIHCELADENRIKQMKKDTNIWIYQPGKVGSSTIRETLKQYDVETAHIHTIAHLVQKNADVKALIEQKKRNGLKIISLVREPISRDFADYMQNYSMRCGLQNISAANYMKKLAKENHQFEYFNRELKVVFHIDVYKYPFDQEKGYAIIKSGNIEVLILKLEKLEHNEKVLEDFVQKGISNLKLKNANVGKDKEYAQLYQDLKRNLKLNRAIVDCYYKDNGMMDHFYSQEEKIEFLKKWEANIV